MRAVAVVASLLVATAVAPAGGAACPLVTDPAHDETSYAGGSNAVDRPWLDIRSVDVEVQRRYVVAVVRTGDFAPREAAGRSTWMVDLTAGRAATYELVAEGSLAATRFVVYRSSGDLIGRAAIGTVTGSVDPTRRTVTIVAPRSLFGADFRDGARLTMTVDSMFGEPGVLTVGADYTRPVTVVAGRRGCLPEVR